MVSGPSDASSDEPAASSRPQSAAEREAFVARQLSAGLADLERFPRYINIETINTCNARCIMCGIDFDKKPAMRMADEVFRKIVDELSSWRHHVRKVNLYFDCEPLLDRTLPEKIRTLKQAGMRAVAIATNASILPSSKAEQLIGAGLDEIYISIDSMSPEVYEKIRVGLSFEKVYANTLGFIRTRDALGGPTRVRVQMVLQESNSREAEAFAVHWRERLSPGDVVAVHRAHNWGGAVNVIAFEGDRWINSLPCTSLWSNAMIHVDGSVALCSVDTVQGSPHALGDVARQTIEEIWKSEKMRTMRKMHLDARRDGHPLCDGCTAWREHKNEIMLHIKADDASPARIPA